MKSINITCKRKLKSILFISFIICILLIIRIGFIQFVQGSELESMAYMQQTLNRKIRLIDALCKKSILFFDFFGGKFSFLRRRYDF